jgi:hypothetical protein
MTDVKRCPFESKPFNCSLVGKRCLVDTGFDFKNCTRHTWALEYSEKHPGWPWPDPEQDHCKGVVLLDPPRPDPSSAN